MIDEIVNIFYKVVYNTKLRDIQTSNIQYYSVKLFYVILFKSYDFS